MKVRPPFWGLTPFEDPSWTPATSTAAMRFRGAPSPTDMNPEATRVVITAFERSPDGGKGLARDMRVRWALEEVGQPYKVRLLSFDALEEPAHLVLHPFG